MKDVNLHNTTLWYSPSGTAYLTFAANAAGQVFTTSLEGKLVHVLNGPSEEDNFNHPAVDKYFSDKGNFVPTDVEELDGLFYVTTGYSSLDLVLTARILGMDPFKVAWHDLAFGGRGEQIWPVRYRTRHYSVSGEQRDRRV